MNHTPIPQVAGPGPARCAEWHNPFHVTMEWRGREPTANCAKRVHARMARHVLSATSPRGQPSRIADAPGRHRNQYACRRSGAATKAAGLRAGMPGTRRRNRTDAWILTRKVQGGARLAVGSGIVTGVPGDDVWRVHQLQHSEGHAASRYVPLAELAVKSAHIQIRQQENVTIRVSFGSQMRLQHCRILVQTTAQSLRQPPSLVCF